MKYYKCKIYYKTFERHIKHKNIFIMNYMSHTSPISCFSKVHSIKSQFKYQFNNNNNNIKSNQKMLKILLEQEMGGKKVNYLVDITNIFSNKS